MPEIAEVEIVRRELESLKGQELEAFEARGKLRARGREEQIVGSTLNGVKRRGKLLGFDFGELLLLSHLRMTGRFVFRRDPAARAELCFSSSPLCFLDPRGFATMEIVERGEWPMGLGPDLWQVTDDEDWLPEERFMKSKRAAKASILDQRLVAGIGNYLADESLWRAGISPIRPTASLIPEEWREILKGAGQLSLSVLQAGGVTVRDYRNSHGEEGRGQVLLKAYGRAGQTCLRCGASLVKNRVAGRGTTWCPGCQS